MFQDKDAFKLFERQHARDRVREMARHIGEPSDDLDVFSAHARVESRSAFFTGALVFAIVAMLLAAAVMMWR